MFKKPSHKPPREIVKPRPTNRNNKLLGNKRKPEVPKAGRPSAKSNRSWPESSPSAKMPSKKRKVISTDEKETNDASLVDSKQSNGVSANGTLPPLLLAKKGKTEVPKAGRKATKSSRSFPESSHSGKTPSKKRKVIPAIEEETNDASLVETESNSEEDGCNSDNETLPLLLNGDADELDDTIEIEAGMLLLLYLSVFNSHSVYLIKNRLNSVAAYSEPLL